MPNIRSAKKRVKVSATKTAANKARKSNLKTMIKKADAACAANAADKEAAVRVAIKRVDQACAKGLMHKECSSSQEVSAGKEAERCKVSGCLSFSQKRKSVCPNGCTLFLRYLSLRQYRTKPAWRLCTQSAC